MRAFGVGLILLGGKADFRALEGIIPKIPLTFEIGLNRPPKAQMGSAYKGRSTKISQVKRARGQRREAEIEGKSFLSLQPAIYLGTPVDMHQGALSQRPYIVTMVLGPQKIIFVFYSLFHRVYFKLCDW
jgi:hypothetical protein